MDIGNRLNWSWFLNGKIKTFQYKIRIFYLIFLLIVLRFSFLFDLELIFLISFSLQIILFGLFFTEKEKQFESLAIITHFLFLIFYITDSKKYFQETIDNLTKIVYFFSIFVVFITEKKNKYLELFLPFFHFISFSFFLSILLLYKEIYKIDYELFFKLNLLLVAPILFTLFHFIYIFKSFLELKNKLDYLKYTISRYILILGIFIISYSYFNFYYEWKRIYNVFQTFKILRIEQNYEMNKIPEWLSLSLKLEKNFTLYEFLNQKSKKNFILTKILRNESWNYPIDLKLIKNFYFPELKNENEQIQIEKISTEVFYKKNFFEVKLKFYKPKSKFEKLFFTLNKESVIPKKYKNIRKLNSFTYVIDFKDMFEFEFIYFQRNTENKFLGLELLNSNNSIAHQIKLINFNGIKLDSKFYHLEKDFMEGNYFSNGKFISNWILEIFDEEFEKKTFKKIRFDEIIFLMNDSISNEIWLERYEYIQKKFSNRKIHILSKSWFTPRNFIEAKEKILNSQNPKTHLIPFQLFDKTKIYFIITGDNESFIELKSLKPSFYYSSLIDFFKLPKRKIYLSNFNNKIPNYIQDLLNYEYIYFVQQINEEFYVSEIKMFDTNNLSLTKSINMYNYISENSNLLEDFKFPIKQKLEFEGIIHEFE